MMSSTTAAAAGSGHGTAPDRPYAALHDSGAAGSSATHVLERRPDGSFSGYAACGAAADGWLWSPSGAVTCGACRRAAGDMDGNGSGEKGA